MDPSTQPPLQPATPQQPDPMQQAQQVAPQPAPASQPVAQAAVAPTPQQTQFIAQEKIYFTPEGGGRSLFAYKPHIATVYPGVMMVADMQGMPVAQFQLTPDTKLRNLLGQANFTHVAGQKIGLTRNGYTFFFYNPRWFLVSYIPAYVNTRRAKRFADAVRSAIQQQSAPPAGPVGTTQIPQ